MHIFKYICMYIHIFAYIYYMYTHTCVFVSVCMHGVCIHMCVYVFECMYIQNVYIFIPHK